MERYGHRSFAGSGLTLVNFLLQKFSTDCTKVPTGLSLTLSQVVIIPNCISRISQVHSAQGYNVNTVIITVSIHRDKTSINTL